MPILDIGKINGSILIYPVGEATIKKLASMVSCVSIVHEYPGAGVSRVECDNIGGIRMLMERLHALGHQEDPLFMRSNATALYRKCRNHPGNPG